MKSWLRSRKGDSAATQPSPAPMPPISIKSVPPLPSHHEWDALAGSAAASIKDNENPPQRRESARAPVAANKRTTKQLVEDTAAHISPSPITHQQHILVHSEHYFRLALESWEQLRACHFKASQKFSLAEWMHIHALLLYGRIQLVRKALNAEPAAPRNRIDLSSDVAVFEPLATLLNTIGVVQDKETGITYVPDALFPGEAQTSFMTYTASEMQSILDGTMYDWQRSWKRVLEARHQRDTKYTQFSLVRSSSELIFAIREKSELISRIQRAPEQKRDSFVLSDFKHELGQLQELLEEARNAKDYTIRPPCVRVYDRTEDMLHDHAVSAPDLHSASQHRARPRPMDYRVLDPGSPNIPQSPQLDFSPAHGASVPFLEKSARVGDFSNDAGTNSKDQEDEFNLNSVESTKAGESSDPSDHIAAMVQQSPEVSEPTKPSKHSRGELDAAKAAIPLRSALRKGSANLLPELRDKAISASEFSGSADASFTDIVNSSESTLRSDSPVKERDTFQLFPGHQMSRGSPPKRNHRVQIAGAADASDCFVHFDARIWQEYQAFVDALKSTKLTKFASLKKEREGSFAWMLPVKFNDAKQPIESSTQPTLQSTPQMITPLHKQSLQIRLPRTSIPRTELALALLLQTSSVTPEVNDSWHVETRAELDMRQYVLDFVNTGIFDSRAI